MNWQTITESISSVSGLPFKLEYARPLAGGDINAAYCLQGADRSYFVKLNRAEMAAMFAAESAGLTEMASTGSVTVPRPVVHGATLQHGFLVLEYIEFGTGGKTTQARLGQQLASLHQQRQPYFGWHQDNTIGSTRQPNNRCENWVTFWRDYRLQFQLDLAASKGYRGHLQASGSLLNQRLSDFFCDYLPHPSLLHGDLWGGNAASDKAGNPIIFDPACYYGDREADLAMTELFGGFSREFYAAYNDVYPLDPGYTTRKKLYNLYHILNHLNLFGGGYLSQAEHLISSLLSEIK